MEEHIGKRFAHMKLNNKADHFWSWETFKYVCVLFQFTLGGFEQLQSIKVCKREELGLPPLPEDSIRVIRSMRAASPPASASDLIEQQQKRARREHKVVIRDMTAQLLVMHNDNRWVLSLLMWEK